MYVCVLQAYHDPMLKLSIMTEQELNQIFGTLDSLIPLHEGRKHCDITGWGVFMGVTWLKVSHHSLLSCSSTYH